MKLKKWVVLCWVVLSSLAIAQGNGRLYDPEPPADSAYVRVVVAAKSTTVDVAVDGKVRVRTLPSQEASEYLVLAEGNHTIALLAAGKQQTLLSKSVDIAKGKSLTLAFATTKSDARLTVFEDKGNTNKLKATLAAYNLSSKGSLDVGTADGASKVFSALASGSSAAIQVNPIAVELSGKNDSGVGKTKLEMTQGGTYSVMAFDDANGRLYLKVFQSRVERYTGP